MPEYEQLPQQVDAGLEAEGIRVSPAQSAGVVARLLFTWQTPLFVQGATEKITPEDMDAWPLRQRDSCEASALALEQAWKTLVDDTGKTISPLSAGLGHMPVARAGTTVCEGRRLSLYPTPKVMIEGLVVTFMKLKLIR